MTLTFIRKVKKKLAVPAFPSLVLRAPLRSRETNPSEKAALERRVLNLLRQACRIEEGTA